MKDIYFSDLTMEELETLCRDANNELIRRKKQEQKEDWEKVVTALKVYIKKYEEIEIDYGGDGNIVFDSETTFPEAGTIHPACYYC